ncbi:mutS protein homolog 5-like isoform X2 [Aphis gossypii]|uniref:mutS protein homolog 5-like isoform X2 n=1 Tax=Aphis gossypii TaxID=80765 RepID=UPI0021590DD7|nr:mutS protein homolog 5-like isoform X2 [Aphis gossypii]
MDLSTSSSATCSIDFSSVDYSNYDTNNINKSDCDATLNTDDTDIFLSIYWKSGMLGAASYNSQISEIQILHDIIESNLDFKILNALFMQLRPVNIVVSSLQDGHFLKIIKQLAHNGKINMFSSPTTTDDYKSDEKVHILPKKCFKFKTCEQLILSMSLASAPKNEKSRKLYIRSLVDFTQELTVCALGALLHFLDTPLVKLNLPTNFTIMSLKILNMDNLVWLGISTYESLQIFSAHEHPSIYKWTKNSTKEGPSIFSLLNRCNSVMGSKFLKNILAQPTKNLDIIKYRHEFIEFCINPSNESVILSLTNCIKHCRCVSTAINAITIGEICERYSEQITFFTKIKETLKDSLYTMVNAMSCIIDFEKSSIQNRFVVKLGFIPELDERKSKIESITELLNEITLKELQDLPSYINECSICQMPEVGFLLCLPFWKPYNLMTENDYKIQDLEFKFHLTDKIFYKTSRCYELDKYFGEIESSIIQEEIQTMTKLSEFIIQHWISDLHLILKLIAELDCLIGFADVAKDLKLIKPNILPKEHCIINIINGRHILQEKYVDKFVPNSYHSSKVNQSIKIITGFNSSGKSIYLKQIALISYLCHIGCYVPAEYTEISILDHIHTRIQSTESVSSLMSAFMVDLKQMSVALNESTCKSLVILDEFGKGTSEINGLALLLASISDFVHRPLHLLPHVIISTHFHSLPNLLQQIINKDILNDNVQYLSMSYTTECSKIVCLYRVIDQIKNQNKSMAHSIAAQNGLPKCIVERANKVLLSIQQDECISPMTENLRYKLFYRRKHFIERVLELMQNKITDAAFKDLVNDMENIRYP